MVKIRTGQIDPTNSEGFTSYTPTQVGWASVTTFEFFWKQVGKLVYVKFSIAGTSNSTAVNFTLPTPVRTSGQTYGFEGVLGLAQDNGTFKTGACRFIIDPAGDPTHVNCYGDMVTGSWTASGTKLVRGTLIYEAA